MSPYSADRSSANPSDINQKPIGTGPFVFKSYQKDSNIRYTGNKDYWKPEDVKIDNLIFAITTDPSVRMQKLKKNECQITIYPRRWMSMRHLRTRH